MKKSLISFIVGFCMVISILLFKTQNVFPEGTRDEQFCKDLAQYWAPLLYHDVGISYGEKGLEDIPMKINFDNDWVGTNNWEDLEIEYYNIPGYDFKAYVYYSVQETETNYFITYALFHPKDESNNAGSIDKHENDLEHILISIKKNESEYGEFHLMITQAHSGWKMYKKSSLLFEDSHVKVWVDSGGHAIYRYDGSDALGIRKDGVVYYNVEEYSNNSTNSFFEDRILNNEYENIGNFTRKYEYTLLNYNYIFIKNLIDYKNDNHELFASFGKLRGDTHGKNVAGDTWAGTSLSGYYTIYTWSDPVAFFDRNFSNSSLGNLSHTYLYNKNYTYKLTVDKITYYGGNHNIYLDIYVDGVKYASNHIWKKNNVAYGQVVPVNFFGDDSKDSFLSPSKSLYIARPHSKPDKKISFKIDVKRKSGLIFYYVDSYNIDDIENLINDNFISITTQNGKAVIDLKVEMQLKQ